MKAIIITIGDEILMGQILDTNSQYIARSLTDMGVEITEILSIPDKRDEIYETVEYAMSEADLIIVTVMGMSTVFPLPELIGNLYGQRLTSMGIKSLFSVRKYRIR